MPRQKMYFKWEIPTSVVNVTVAILADYSRRERAIKYSSITGAVLDRYIELNNAVDLVLKDTEPAVRKEMLVDMENDRGYNRSQAQYFMSRNTYYQRRRKIIHDLAKELSLLP